MYEKTITFTKTSCKGKVFECTRTIVVYTDEEKQEKHDAYLARKREERRRLKELERLGRESYIPDVAIRDILDCYEEYVREMRDFEY